MIICNCNLNQLVQLETILFAVEWKYNPHIPPFSIRCDDELYSYKIAKTIDRYRIVTV